MRPAHKRWIMQKLAETGKPPRTVDDTMDGIWERQQKGEKRCATAPS